MALRTALLLPPLSFNIKRLYEKTLLPFERQLAGVDIPLHASTSRVKLAPPAGRRRSSKRSHLQQGGHRDSEEQHTAGTTVQGKQRWNKVRKVEAPGEAASDQQDQQAEQPQHSPGGEHRQQQLEQPPPQQRAAPLKLEDEEQDEQQSGEVKQEEQQVAYGPVEPPDVAPPAAPAAPAATAAEPAEVNAAAAGAEAAAQEGGSMALGAPDDDGWEGRVQQAAAALAAGEAMAAAAAAEGAGEHELMREDEGQQPSESNSPTGSPESVAAAAAAAAFAGDVDRLASSRAGQARGSGRFGSPAWPSSPPRAVTVQAAARRSDPAAVGAVLTMPVVPADCTHRQQSQGRPPRPTRACRTQPQVMQMAFLPAVAVVCVSRRMLRRHCMSLLEARPLTGQWCLCPSPGLQPGDHLQPHAHRPDPRHAAQGKRAAEWRSACKSFSRTPPLVPGSTCCETRSGLCLAAPPSS